MLDNTAAERLYYVTPEYTRAQKVHLERADETKIGVAFGWSNRTGVCTNPRSQKFAPAHAHVGCVHRLSGLRIRKIVRAPNKRSVEFWKL
jgi:hypothetical protein